ncbi:MAG TPA: hypothetical protein VGM11_01920 [Acidobacteriaceae bacterium]
MKKPLKRTLGGYVDALRRWNREDIESVFRPDKLLMGQLASRQIRAMGSVNSLADVEFSVSSQFGEDGIIEWLVERAQIPLASCSFIEFGVENYAEANTRFLLQNRNWRGLILDGGPGMQDEITRAGLRWKYDLAAKTAFITRENINALIEQAGFTGEVGLLSVDVDGNDYWIWEAIDVVQPIVCVCEYNAIFGDVYPLSVPYDPGFLRTTAHFSNLYFGASIRALCLLGERKGYRFAGTTSHGDNAFFVREDYARRFLDQSIRNFDAAPTRGRQSRDESGELNFLRGADRLRQISGMLVVNTETGETAKLGDLGLVYSEAWEPVMAR